jgi:hypothetical protein
MLPSKLVDPPNTQKVTMHVALTPPSTPTTGLKRDLSVLPSAPNRFKVHLDARDYYELKLRPIAVLAHEVSEDSIRCLAKYCAEEGIATAVSEALVE